MAALGCLAILSSCNLDYDEITNFDDKEVIFEDFTKTASFVTNLYGYLEDFPSYNGAMLTATTDESEYAQALSGIHYFYNGTWSPRLPLMSWSNLYAGIRGVNRFLRDTRDRTFEDFAYSDDYDQEMERFNNYKWEVRFLRAWFYFDLVRKFGDVPFVGDRVLTQDEANSLSRTPSAQIFDYIISECDAVAAELPDTYVGRYMTNEIGRATKGMALALKGRVALYAASPLFNTMNDQTLWLRAAKANKAVIDYMNGRGVTISGTYESLWGSSSYNNPEIILPRIGSKNNTFEKQNFPVGRENAGGGHCPTQNLVDAYQMTNGKFWDEEGSGYDPEKPWENRDPRFYLTIAKNGDEWPNNAGAIQTYYGGANGLPYTNATPTSYYLKKFLDPSLRIGAENASTSWHTWIMFRLGEFYLNYAEAVYHYLGSADAINGDFPTSAVASLNVLRSRPGVGMPDLPSGMDQATFEKYYESERMVELAFEDHRYYDVRRWKKAADRFKNIIELRITRNGDSYTYQRQTVTRLWDDKMYFSPISESEIQKNSNLTQNPGWN